MPIVDRYRGPNAPTYHPLPFVVSKPVVVTALRPRRLAGVRGLGWLPDIQPAGMPGRHGGLAGFGDITSDIIDPTALDTALQSVQDIVDTGLNIYQTVDTATSKPATVVRRTTTSSAPLFAGSGMIIAGLAALYFLSGKRGRRR